MENRRGKVEALSMGSKITTDGNCSLKIKRHLLLGRNAMKNLDSELNSRDITLLTKICVVKAMVFSVVMYRCESWTKEGWVPRNWYLWTVVLGKTLESPLDNKEIKSVNPKGNQSWIFIGRTEAETEAPILWPPDAKNWFTGKDPDSGKDWRPKRRRQQRMRRLNSITDSMDMNLSKVWEIVEDRGAWHAAIHEVTKRWTWFSDWTTTTTINN